MPRTTVDFFEVEFGDIDEYLEQYDKDSGEERTMQEAAVESYRKFSQEYYEDLADESDIFEVYRQDESII